MTPMGSLCSCYRNSVMFAATAIVLPDLSSSFSCVLGVQVGYGAHLWGHNFYLIHSFHSFLLEEENGLWKHFQEKIQHRLHPVLEHQSNALIAE